MTPDARDPGAADARAAEVEARTAQAVADAERCTGRYLDLLRDHEPVTWTAIGGSGRDEDLPDRSSEGLAARSRALAALDAEVRDARDRIDVDTRGEGREARDDLGLLADELEHRRFEADHRARDRTDPLAAIDSVSGAVHELLGRPDLPAERRAARVASALDRAARIGAFLEVAGRTLETSPSPHLDVALARLDGLADLVGRELPRRAAEAGLPADRVDAATRSGIDGIEAFGALLEGLRDATPAPWRLGPEDHAATLRTALGSVLAPDVIAARAEAQVAEVHAELAELSGAGWSRRFPGEALPTDADERIRRTLADVAATALPREELLGEARRAVDEAYAFSRELGLCDLPPAERLTVTEVPGYLAGVAGAFITAPPALDVDGGCVYYLSPVPDHWDEARAASFLREYSPPQLRSLALHEGYPGHAVQLEHAARHPRVLRRVVGRAVFAEGWAVHVERVAVAEGFGEGTGSAVRREDYRLTQRKLELRIATNALLDVGLHTGDLDDAGARALLTERAFQEDAEADGKLVRAKVTSGQLCSYFVGGAELGDLEAAERARAGASFDRRGFHQRVLSHGTPTFAVVARALADGAPARRPFALPSA